MMTDEPRLIVWNNGRERRGLRGLEHRADRAVMIYDRYAARLGIDLCV